MGRHGDLKHIYAESPVAMECAAGYFATQLRHAEQALQDERPFLVAGRLTTAELTTCLSWAVNYRVPVTAACLAYMERITSRPAYHASVAANTPRTA
jgi:glutathione S-transferase